MICQVFQENPFPTPIVGANGTFKLANMFLELTIDKDLLASALIVGAVELETFQLVTEWN